MAVAVTSVNRVCPVCKESYPFLEKHICALGEIPSGLVSDDPMIGAVLGERYQIDSYLASGGMGMIYKARHIVLDKPVAIKLLRESQDPVAQQRFLLEAKSACHIGHEHIVDITDFGVLEDGRPYLVMEFLQGQSLETLLSERGALPYNRACRIGEQIARGLQAVHEKGIMHRDLKPGNIFLLDRQKRDFVKILDFGIAKVMAGTRESLADGKEIKQLVNMRQTTQGTVLGTPEYLSPEQAAGEPIDARVDIYALGCILYEMLTGEVPFRGNGPMSTLMKHLTETAIKPRKRRPDLGIPESLEAIVLRAMAREKADRFPTMEALAEALLSEVEQSPTYHGEMSLPGLPPGHQPSRGSPVAVAAPASIASTTVATVVQRPFFRGRWRRSAWVAGGILLILLGALWFSFRQSWLRADLRTPPPGQGQSDPTKTNKSPTEDAHPAVVTPPPAHPTAEEPAPPAHLKNSEDSPSPVKSKSKSRSRNKRNAAH